MVNLGKIGRCFVKKLNSFAWNSFTCFSCGLLINSIVAKTLCLSYYSFILLHTCMTKVMITYRTGVESNNVPTNICLSVEGKKKEIQTIFFCCSVCHTDDLTWNTISQIEEIYKKKRRKTTSKIRWNKNQINP